LEGFVAVYHAVYTALINEVLHYFKDSFLWMGATVMPFCSYQLASLDQLLLLMDLPFERETETVVFSSETRLTDYRDVYYNSNYYYYYYY